MRSARSRPARALAAGGNGQNSGIGGACVSSQESADGEIDGCAPRFEVNPSKTRVPGQAAARSPWILGTVVHSEAESPDRGIGRCGHCAGACSRKATLLKDRRAAGRNFNDYTPAKMSRCRTSTSPSSPTNGPARAAASPVSRVIAPAIANALSTPSEARAIVPIRRRR